MCINKTTYLAPGAHVVGDVTLGKDVNMVNLLIYCIMVVVIQAAFSSETAPTCRITVHSTRTPVTRFTLDAVYRSATMPLYMAVP